MPPLPRGTSAPLSCGWPRGPAAARGRARRPRGIASSSKQNHLALTTPARRLRDRGDPEARGPRAGRDGSTRTRSWRAAARSTNPPRQCAERANAGAVPAVPLRLDGGHKFRFSDAVSDSARRGTPAALPAPYASPVTRRTRGVASACSSVRCCVTGPARGHSAGARGSARDVTGRAGTQPGIACRWCSACQAPRAGSHWRWPGREKLGSASGSSGALGAPALLRARGRVGRRAVGVPGKARGGDGGG